MKTIITITIAIIAIGINAADLTTKSGKFYKDYEITFVTDQIAGISHEAGAVKIPLSDLPDDVKKTIQPQIDKYAKKKAVEAVENISTAPATEPKKGTPAPVKTIKEDSPEIKRILSKIKDNETKIAELKKELKKASGESQLKATFKNGANDYYGSKARGIKENESRIKNHIKILEDKNAGYWSMVESLRNKRGSPPPPENK